MSVKEVGCEDVNWIHLARDRQNWRDIVKSVMNFGFRKMRDNSCLTVDLLPSQEGLCSVELFR
jgi:hypothetical protein